MLARVLVQYTLAESTMLADVISDPKHLTVATAQVSSTKGGAQILGFLAGGRLAATSARIPFVLSAGCCVVAATVLSVGVAETAPAKACARAKAESNATNDDKAT
eukprot:SAG31_NODE_11883_length_989_cov_0.711236_1_plen_104_part_01